MASAETAEAKQAVEAHYREVAVGARAGQCAFDLASAGYTKADLEGIPSSLCDMSQGCGSVTALGVLSPGSTVVDIGSGAGLDLFLARKRVGPSGRVIGVEPVAEMRVECQKYIDEAGYPNVEVREGDANHLPVENDSVDAVLSNCVFSLINDESAMHEVRRVLKPNSRFVFSDIFVRGPFLWFFYLLRALLGGKLSMLRRFELSRTRRIGSLKRAGFASIEILSESKFSPQEVKNLLVETGLPAWMTPIGRMIIYRSELAATKA